MSKKRSKALKVLDSQIDSLQREVELHSAMLEQLKQLRTKQEVALQRLAKPRSNNTRATGAVQTVAQ